MGDGVDAEEGIERLIGEGEGCAGIGYLKVHTLRQAALMRHAIGRGHTVLVDVHARDPASNHRCNEEGRTTGPAPHV